ncbi:hypothetical protein ACLOJK_025070 [Asimina triloba]
MESPLALDSATRHTFKAFKLVLPLQPPPHTFFHSAHTPPSMLLSHRFISSRTANASITAMQSHLRAPLPSHHLHKLHLPKPHIFKPISTPPKSSFLPSCTTQSRPNFPVVSDASDSSTNPTPELKQESDGNSFWAAVSLILGTAVGPGILGLPSATIQSGPLPSAIAVVISWVYVISSILLVAELSFAAMEEGGVDEVSFTGLATNAFGGRGGAFVAVVYACLSFALLVACASGISSLFIQWFPSMHPIVAHSIFPGVVAAVIGLFPYMAIDAANRLLCIVMVFSLAALVAVGSSVGRNNILSSFSHASWSPAAILPAIPITVLTLGFHVITPFICKIMGRAVFEARKAIVFGGIIPLLMVLSWNFVVLGLAGTSSTPFKDPIRLLLSVSSSALPAIQGFAFTALATSFICYAISFPKQLVDTLDLIFRMAGAQQVKVSLLDLFSTRSEPVEFGVYSGSGKGIPLLETGTGTGTFRGDSMGGFHGEIQKDLPDLDYLPTPNRDSSDLINAIMTPVVLGSSVLIASFFRSAFSAALNFAGVYANCFLFGILPPVMVWIHRSKKKSRYPFSLLLHVTMNLFVLHLVLDLLV